MLLFIASLGATILLTLLLERLVQPRMDPRPILHRVSMLSAMPVIMFYVSIFMITYRPLFAAAATLITMAGIVVVNNSKYAILKEPLVFSDFALLRYAIRHPALYVGHIGPWRIAAVLLSAVAAIVAAAWFEPALIERASATDYFPTFLYLFVVIGMIYAVTRGPFRGSFLQLLHRFGPQVDLRKDVDKLSLVVCLIFYFLLANATSPPKQSAPPKPKAAPPQPASVPFNRLAGSPLPPLIAVQSESFFDVRRVHPTIPQSLLQRWDAIAAEACYHGRLMVPAWAANTMRTEFAFLSGLPNEALGVHRFNPYLHLCRSPVWTIAHQLRAMGYRTVCLHPYPASFFDRDRSLPNLGFDEFLDLSAFEAAPRLGPYVSDLAVADKILELLDAGAAPLFIFAITMENHGKWEEGRFEQEPARLRSEAEPLGSPELAMYLRHLASTDDLVERLTNALRRRDDDAVLCVYGDHVPGLEVIRRLRYTDPRTEYLVWRKSGRHPRTVDIGVDGLNRLVLDAVLNEANQAPIRGDSVGAA